MTPQDLENLKMIFISVEQGDLGILKALGIRVSNMVFQNVSKLSVITHHVHVADFIPQEPSTESFRAYLWCGLHLLRFQRKFPQIQRKICHQTIFALIWRRQVILA